ncbi:MAG: adenylate/guanylate cyclase domain-containing protein [Deltaproteobacteria bacterium]|nr:adenylate/guanylate cyclase domain-containing protein [Deltaproteobacteria bacterium]
MDGSIVVQRVVDCESDPPAIWRVISDTDRLNRAAGLGRLTIAPRSDSSASRFDVRTVSGGLPMEYAERPFEWVEAERFSVRREVRKGLIRTLEHAFGLAPRDGGGSRLEIRISVVPRSALLAPVVRFTVSQILGRVVQEIVAADRALAQGEPIRMKAPAPIVNRDELERAAAELRARVGEGGQAAAAALIDLVRRGADFEASSIRPFELADDRGLDRRNVLSVCLDAVVAGLVDLSWQIVCPSCRGAPQNVASLVDLDEKGHCPYCDISFGVELDRAVEATFRAAPAVRKVDPSPYCIGGPGRVPHVVAQSILPARGEATLRAPAAPGRYRLFVRGGATASVEVVEGAAESARLEVRSDGLTPQMIAVAPRGAIVVAQEAPLERHAKLERLEWASRAATAHFVTTVPAFRRMFAKEVLRPGLVLRVARVALLFSDLTGSTALYTRTGDARAFRTVQDHFELLRAIVERHEGTIVKTMGDAVMAAFLDEAQALQAALEMQAAFPGFRAAHPEAHDAFLKIGIYAGPCYGVTANGILDYFGQSANIAARLQGAARAGQVVVPEELAARAAELGWLGDARISETFAASLKGLAEPVRASRLEVDAL